MLWEGSSTKESCYYCISCAIGTQNLTSIQPFYEFSSIMLSTGTKKACKCDEESFSSPSLRLWIFLNKEPNTWRASPAFPTHILSQVCQKLYCYYVLLWRKLGKVAGRIQRNFLLEYFKAWISFQTVQLPLHDITALKHFIAYFRR